MTAHTHTWPRPLLAAAGTAVLATAAWAFWPLRPDALPALPMIPPAASQPQVAQAALDSSAFQAPLWVSPAPPPPPPPPPLPPPPLKLQLLAILNNNEPAKTPGGTSTPFKAVLFDPDRDAIITVSIGDTAGPGTVSEITPTTVAIKDSTGVRTLDLNAPAKPGANQGGVR